MHSPFGYCEWCEYDHLCRFLFEHPFSVLLGMHVRMESLSHTIILLNLFKNCQIVLHYDCTISHSHQQCMKALISLHFDQLFFVLSVKAIMAGVKCYFTVVFLKVKFIGTT